MFVFNDQLTIVLTVLHLALMGCCKQAPAHHWRGSKQTHVGRARQRDPRGHTQGRAEPAPGHRGQSSVPTLSDGPSEPWPAVQTQEHRVVLDPRKMTHGTLE